MSDPFENMAAAQHFYQHGLGLLPGSYNNALTAEGMGRDGCRGHEEGAQFIHMALTRAQTPLGSR